MSDRKTSVGPRERAAFGPNGYGRVGGLHLRGRVQRGEAIEEFRAHFEAQRDEALAALSLTDEQLRVETFLGPYAQRNREEVTDD